MKKSIVLFSGGLDSTTATYWALERYEKIFALTFDYGQRNRIELDMAGKVALSVIKGQSKNFLVAF